VLLEHDQRKLRNASPAEPRANLFAFAAPSRPDAVNANSEIVLLGQL
jgi:hypothetical protein